MTFAPLSLSFEYTSMEVFTVLHAINIGLGPGNSSESKVLISPSITFTLCLVNLSASSGGVLSSFGFKIDFISSSRNFGKVAVITRAFALFSFSSSNMANIIPKIFDS
ncbi:107aa long hypothetical protein [Pyrococcus horikoshii OT3]|uniref:Uncharacterized protein n=1 Tax=Pyrococcus horikoshii (strain ATCC 700860 / DSM 12428 / JCM 9974 / NBRC 100139 / OT-3) TaxID=70601 RepID=O58937_PYRHO|nr:107aa long hypothetical protein [Pyrococcus horikoshii OT3]